MKKYFFSFWLLMGIGTAGAVLSACGGEDDAPAIAVSGISLDTATLTLAVGEEYTLRATVLPEDATDKTVAWASSDPAKATVADGKVAAVAVGTATITAKAGDKTATCIVNIAIAVSGISLDTAALTLAVGEEYTLRATVLPDNATDKTVAWASSDVTVATVANGKISALKVGETTITAKAGDMTAICNVIVKEPLNEGFTVDASSIGNFKPLTDGISGTITNTGGSNYRVRSRGGMWWMIQNADKPLTAGDGCTYSSIDRGEYGHLYSWSCASSACPSGWELPTDEDFTALSSWLTLHNKWSDWNTGSSLAGYGYNGSYSGLQGSYGGWWSSSSSGRYWNVNSGNSSGNFFTSDSNSSFSVRCRKSQ